MKARRTIRRRRLFVPEVVQTSGMDCGPASLSALLNGCRTQVDYGRLRDACQTDVDGTSIDALEEIARSLGFPAEQVMVPADHVLLDESAVLPAIAVVRDPVGAAHFIVIWRRHGPFVQVMDPARGRLWLRCADLLRQLYVHTVPVPAAAWREWAGSGAFIGPLTRRLRAMGVSRSGAASHVAAATADSSWRRLAALDAAVRMLTALVSSRALRRADARRSLGPLVDAAAGTSGPAAVPGHYWSVRPLISAADKGEQLALRGAVLVRCTDAAAGIRAPESGGLAATVSEPPARPFRHLVDAAREDGLLTPLVAGLALALAVAGVVVEAVLLRGVLEVGTFLQLREQKLAAGLALTAFVGLLLGLELLLGSAERRIGAHLDARLRMRFLTKIPELADSYFQTRPIADMIERSHGVHLLRMLPPLAIRFLRAALEIAVTTAAIGWLAPQLAAPAVVIALAAVAVPALGHSLVAERDLRVRTHAGALTRFHLDALRGRTAIEAHSASQTIEREHERLLAEWADASLSLQRSTVVIEGVQMVIGAALAGWLLLGQLSAGSTAGMLLLAYWVLNLPALGYELALYAREYPAHRSTLLRLLEPLGAREARDLAGVEAGNPRARTVPIRAAVRVEARGVAVTAAGRRIIHDINLEIAPGEQIAVVGTSGAGKSTLTGLLLGWHQPSEGDWLIDGSPLTAGRLESLRDEIAWVDPTVHIWNRSLIDNLTYGSALPESIAGILDAAELGPVLARLPDGLATPLGENGSLLSAGEAQRVRLGRAMLRRSARLVVLDEPFTGLERDRRRALLARSRRHWAHSTLIYVTHDLTEAQSFDRVLVMEGGRIVEDGNPAVLRHSLSSRFGRLLDVQRRVESRFDAADGWRHLRLDGGLIVDDHACAPFEQHA